MHVSEKLKEIVRFGIVGVAATVIHYVTYRLFQLFLPYGLAFTIAYITSLVFNYICTARFTFRRSMTVKRGAGFFTGHVINYVLQMVLFYLFLHIGIKHVWAPFFVYCITIPINFLLVRFVFHKL